METSPGEREHPSGSLSSVLRKLAPFASGGCRCVGVAACVHLEGMNRSFRGVICFNKGISATPGLCAPITWWEALAEKPGALSLSSLLRGSGNNQGSRASRWVSPVALPLDGASESLGELLKHPCPGVLPRDSESVSPAWDLPS